MLLIAKINFHYVTEILSGRTQQTFHPLTSHMCAKTLHSGSIAKNISRQFTISLPPFTTVWLLHKRWAIVLSIRLISLKQLLLTTFFVEVVRLPWSSSVSTNNKLLLLSSWRSEVISSNNNDVIIKNRMIDEPETTIDLFQKAPEVHVQTSVRKPVPPAQIIFYLARQRFWTSSTNSTSLCMKAFSIHQ